MELEVSIKKNLGNFNLDVDFSSGNSTYGLLGANGSGKSVTLQCIAGLITPDSGYIRLQGRTLFDSEKKINIPPRKREVGYLLQHYALFPHMTVEENLLAGLSPKGKKQKVPHMLSMLVLTNEKRKYPHEISGGQAQRVALGRMLLSSPKVLLLDEPFSALDSYLKWQVEQELFSLLADFHGPRILVSHNRDEVYRLCDEVGIMEEGSIDSQGTPEEVMSHPKTISAARLSGCKNIFPCRVKEEGIFLQAPWETLLTTSHPISKNTTHVALTRLSTGKQSEKDNPVKGNVYRKIEDTRGILYVIEPLWAVEWGGKIFDFLHLEIPEKSQAPNFSSRERVELFVSPENVYPLT